MQKILGYLKMPSTYVILVVGVILGLAFPTMFSFLKPAAKVLPKSEA